MKDLNEKESPAKKKTRDGLSLRSFCVLVAMTLRLLPTDIRMSVNFLHRKMARTKLIENYEIQTM